MNTLKNDLGKLYEINSSVIRESAELQRKNFEKYMEAQYAIYQKAFIKTSSLVQSAFDCA